MNRDGLMTGIIHVVYTRKGVWDARKSLPLVHKAFFIINRSNMEQEKSKIKIVYYVLLAIVILIIIIAIFPRQIAYSAGYIAGSIYKIFK